MASEPPGGEWICWHPAFLSSWGGFATYFWLLQLHNNKFCVCDVCAHAHTPAHMYKWKPRVHIYVVSSTLEADSLTRSFPCSLGLLSSELQGDTCRWLPALIWLHWYDNRTLHTQTANQTQSLMQELYKLSSNNSPFETKCHHIFQADTKLGICLPHPPECWDRRRAVLYTASALLTLLIHNTISIVVNNTYGIVLVFSLIFFSVNVCFKEDML